MIKHLHNQPIARKLWLSVLLPSLAALIIAGALFLTLELYEFKQKSLSDLTALANLIGNRSTAAILFQDIDLAKENLAALQMQRDVRAACLYDADHRLFAAMLNDNTGKWHCPQQTQQSQTVMTDVHAYVVAMINDGDQRIGTLLIQADFEASYWQKLQFIGLLLSVYAAVSLLSFALSAMMIQMIVRPITNLVQLTRQIASSKNYALRAQKIYRDETGVLVDAFNDLLQTVESQNQAIIQARDHYLALYHNNPTMVFNLNSDLSIDAVNMTGANMLGFDIQDLQNRPLLNFVHVCDLSTANRFLTDCKNDERIAHKQEFRLCCLDNSIIWVRATAQLVNNEQKAASILLVCEDITENYELNQQIAYQANHDPLTGFANRRAFDGAITAALEETQTKSAEHALCYLDLDQFKVVNDTSGHTAGDELLRQLGEMLSKKIRKNDFIARLGGDEFGIVMYGCSLDQAIHACELILNAIKDFHFAWQGRHFNIGVSIGVTAINSNSKDATALLKEADAACYAAKDRGRNRVHAFRPDDKELALRHGQMKWVEKIQQGLEQNRFFLFGQPIVPIANNKEKMHFEVLVRYLDKRNQIVPPGAFLPAAERYNLASSLDRWVISTLFEWLTHHPQCLEQISVCSVNLSGLSLSDEKMLGFIAEQFKQWQIPTQKICFEITETAAIVNLSHATEFINQLRAQGCMFSLDDFGSGLSSFAYLKNLPVDFLKIDGLFVKDILDDSVDLAMVQAINEVGHVMGKKTIAEFVENNLILELLTKLGVDYAQGYGIGKPVPIAELFSPLPTEK